MPELEIPIKEFWERCGFLRQELKELAPKYRHEGNLGWWIPRSEESTKKLPPIDLNSLFQYAVPKAVSLAYKLSLLYPVRSNLYGFSVIPTTGYKEGLRGGYTYVDKDPALALFWALWEVLK